MGPPGPPPRIPDGADRWRDAKPWKNQLNNGWSKVPETSEKPDEFLLMLSQDLAGCESVEVWERKCGTRSAEMSCDGETKFVLFREIFPLSVNIRLSEEDVQNMVRRDDDEEGPLMGGWNRYDEARYLNYSLTKRAPLDEGCEWVFEESYHQIVNGKNILIKQKCGEAEDYVKLYLPFSYGEMEIVEISNEPIQDLAYLRQDFVENIQKNCINAAVFLRDHCQMEDPIVVGNAVYIQMPTGIQYLIEVYNEDNPESKAYLAAFMYFFEGTKPFLVAHPFTTYQQGLGFIEMVQNFSQ
jgi:hypothetical protein